MSRGCQPAANAGTACNHCFRSAKKTAGHFVAGGFLAFSEFSERLSMLAPVEFQRLSRWLCDNEGLSATTAATRATAATAHHPAKTARHHLHADFRNFFNQRLDSFPFAFISDFQLLLVTLNHALTKLSRVKLAASRATTLTTTLTTTLALIIIILGLSRKAQPGGHSRNQQ